MATKMEKSSDGSKRETVSSDLRTDAIEFRAARSEDLEKINALLEKIGFDLGAHILRLYYENSDQCWQVATNAGNEVVAFDSVHVLPLHGIIFSFHSYVIEKFQKRGFIRTMRSSFSTRPRTGNVTSEAMARFPQVEKLDSKLVGYSGCPETERLRQYDSSKEAANTMTITSVRTEGDIRKMLAYDRQSVFLLDRERYMRAWCTESKPDSDEPYTRTMMAEMNGRVVGFGVIRQFSNYHGFQPLYADNTEVAVSLLAELVRSFVEECGREELYVFFEAKNHSMMRFVHEQKFAHCDTEMRYYAKGAAVLKDYCRFDKVYSMCDYWPV